MEIFEFISLFLIAALVAYVLWQLWCLTGMVADANQSLSRLETAIRLMGKGVPQRDKDPVATSTAAREPRLGQLVLAELARQAREEEQKREQQQETEEATR